MLNKISTLCYSPGISKKLASRLSTNSPRGKTLDFCHRLKVDSVMKCLFVSSETGLDYTDHIISDVSDFKSAVFLIGIERH